MGHSGPYGGLAGSCGSGTSGETLQQVKDDDKQDYRDALGVEDSADAVWVQPGYGQLVHFFEGGYLGGNGRTVHQEFEYVFDRAPSGGVNGEYSYYATAGRKVDNADNTSPENHAVNGFPPLNGEWCFKVHGHSKAIAPGTAGEWGPFSKRYCVARSGSGTGVFVTSDRNGKAHFRVANFSGATITNVQLWTGYPGSQQCVFGNVPDGTITGTCSRTLSGTGTLTVWYNGTWVPLDTISYDQ
jgi:hypothetical protein